MVSVLTALMLTAATLAADRQRLGHLLDRLGHGSQAGPMLKALRARGPVPWTDLDREETGDVVFAGEPRERDSRWRISVRRAPEPDE